MGVGLAFAVERLRHPRGDRTAAVTHVRAPVEQDRQQQRRRTIPQVDGPADRLAAFAEPPGDTGDGVLVVGDFLGHHYGAVVVGDAHVVVGLADVHAGPQAAHRASPFSLVLVERVDPPRFSSHNFGKGDRSQVSIQC